LSQNFKTEFQKSLAELGSHFKPSENAKTKTRVIALTAVGVGIAGAFYIRHFNPSTQGFFPLCPFKALTGFACPGCGMTRSFHQLLNGNVTAALDYNVMIAFWLPLFLYLGISLFLFGVRGKGLPQIVPPTALVWVFAVTISLFWVIRNIPVYPFSVLAP